MTTAADDVTVENAFEAYLAGRPVADEGAGLATFAEAVRATATRPGRPNAALAELLATGLLVDQPSPSPRTARSRRRRRFAMFFPALIAKILSAGAVAQAATGAGIAVVVVTSAGAAGVLPGPIQETFSTVVGTETAVEEPTEPTETADPTEVADPTADPTDPAEPTEPTGTENPETGGEVTGPDPDEPFGQWINGRVEHGEVDGRRVSEWAHERNEQRRNRGAEEGTTTPDVEDGTDVEDGGDSGEVTENAVSGSRNGDRKGHGRDD